MVRKNFLSVLSVIAFLSSATSAQVPDKQKVVASAERAFEKFSKAYVGPCPGCAAAVSLSGETVFEKAFGLADLEHNVPNTRQTIFESGSVAKQFTAAALVLLQQDGKLSLDDPVRKYISRTTRLRFATQLAVQPIFKDHFNVQGYVVWFTRDKDGKVTGLHVGASARI